MADLLYFSIPCSFKNQVLTVPALGFKAKGDSPEEALLECIKHTSLYIPLILAKFNCLVDAKRQISLQLEVPFHAAIYTKLQEIEGFTDTLKKKMNNSLIVEAAPADILKYGY